MQGCRHTCIKYNFKKIIKLCPAVLCNAVEQRGRHFIFIDYLVSGNARDSSDLELLTREGITHIINATVNIPNVFENKPQFKYLRIPAEDSNSQDLKQYFEKTISFIGESTNQSLFSFINLALFCVRNPQYFDMIT